MQEQANPRAIGILTINDIFNYGNRLQNYALQEILKPYGDVTTIRFETGATSKVGEMKTHLRRLKIRTVAHMKIAYHGAYGISGKRTLDSLRFTNNYVPDNRLFITAGHLPKRDKLPNRIVLGSDQIWNYNFCSPAELRVRLGLFAPADRLISYAASVGVSEIPRSLQPLYREGLARIPSISVREDRAKELVESISGKPATVVLDPTLMLDASKWSAIFRGFIPENDHYVLTYFLGHPSISQEKIINRYATERGLRIRRILDARDQETSTAGPQDFVELFSKADFIFTDSYHACCFSILFNKNFKVFNRSGFSGKKNMNSRMQTLARLFELEKMIQDEETTQEINHSQISDLLTQRRTESVRWLEQAMS